MHYKDGTPATIGDIVKHDSGTVGIVLGGQIGNDCCSTQVVCFRACNGESYGNRYTGSLKDEKGVIVSKTGVDVVPLILQTRECLKIGHVDLGLGRPIKEFDPVIP